MLRTEAAFGGARVAIDCAARGGELGCVSRGPASVSFRRNLLGGGRRVHLDDERARRIVAGEIVAGRRWLRRARPLGRGAPAWARRMYERSLLVIRALTDRRSGAVAAGARDGWAYVWPRDAGAVAIAFAGAGYPAEARRVARFLLGLDLGAAARFDGAGEPVEGRDAQGDAGRLGRRRGPRGRARRTRVAPPRVARPSPTTRRNPPATTSPTPSRPPRGDCPSRGRSRRKTRPGRFVTRRGLVREAGEPGPGSIRRRPGPCGPSPTPRSSRRVRAHSAAPGGRRRAASASSLPSTGQSAIPGRRPPPGAPGAWRPSATAARLCDLLADLRRAATPAGLLPERVDARTGVPRSTTPLAWSHAFALLALRQLWPGDDGGAVSGALAWRMEVRPATIDDCEAIARGMKVVVDEGRWLATEAGAPVEDLVQRFRASVEWGHFLVVLEDGGELVGALGMHPSAAAGVLSLGMWILPGRRGEGGGRMLMEAAIAGVPAEVHKVELEVFPDNEVAIGLYRSFGFEQEGLRRDHHRRDDGSLHSALLMARLF